jgi:polyferredoxin
VSIGSPRNRREDETLIRRLVYVAFFLEVGLLLVVLPWSTFWDNNYFVSRWPFIRPFLTNHFVRGGITGLGGVNLAAGFADLSLVFTSRESRDATDRPAA